MSNVDAILVYKLAWQLAQAFSTGRKSAPAEVREVENQLYSLSAALAAFKKLLDGGDVNHVLDAWSDEADDDDDGGGGGGGGMTSIRRILSNCEETLRRLEELVQKYNIIGGQKTTPSDPSSSPPPLSTRLTHNITKDYKKMTWLTQKADLTALRSQLMVHTNSLNLVMGVLVNSQATRIEDVLKEHSAILKEIQAWGSAGSHRANTQLVSSTAMTRTGSGSVRQHLVFEVYAELSDGSRKLTCDQATLHDEWASGLAQDDHDGYAPVFECLHHFTNRSNHTAELANYAFSDVSFPFRLLGARRIWMLYKMAERSSNRLLSLIIQNVNINMIAEFETTFVNVIATAKATQMLSQGMATMLAHTSSTTNSLRILNLQSPVNDVPKTLESVTISSAGRVYARSFISSLLLLHYKSLNALNQQEESLEHRSATATCNSAEVVVNYAYDEDQTLDDISRSIIEIRYNTRIKYEASHATVTVLGVPCRGYHDDQQLLGIDETDVTLSFINTQAAKSCADQLEDMKMELFALRLQHPQPDEVIALHLQTARVRSEDFLIPDAEIFILRRPDNRFRLLISSRNKCTIFSQILADDFFSTLGRPANFRTPAWRIQLEDSGETKIYSYDQGLEFLRFSTDEAERMFQLGRFTLSGTMPIRNNNGSVP